jgi:Ca-activated chloride channel homolog
MSDMYGLVSNGSSPVPLEGVRVSGSILGRGARVKVAQRFRNAEKTAIEAVYRFPLPETAAVCGFTALLAGRRVAGSVEERDKAFEMYDDAMARGDGAYLLDQERPNIFTLSVGSLPAGAEAVMEIEYVALLDQRGRDIRFSLPTTISPRYLPADAPDEGGIPASERIHPEYAASVPYGLSIEMAVLDAKGVASVESPSHAIKVSTGDAKKSAFGDAIRVSFAADAVRMDRDFVLSIERREAQAGTVYRFVDAKGAWMQLDMALEEREDEPAGSGPREVIFVLDCSGSMEGDSIGQAKRALEVCLRALEKGTSFNVVRFGSSFQSLFPRPVPYGEQSLGEALGWLKAVDADLGGTEVLPTLESIYGVAVEKGASRSVILLTDGEVGNEGQVMDLVRSGAAQTRFFCVGIGAGPNDHLVRGLARAGGGGAAFIFPGERIEPKVLAIFRQALSPRVSGLRIEWGSGAEQSPAEPTLQVGEPMSAWARLPKGAAPDSLTVKADVGGKPMSWQFTVVDAGAGQLPLPTLWARERIRSLEEGQGAAARGSRQARPRTDAWKQEVIALAREFGLSSSLTSWIAVEEREEKDKQTGEIVLRKVPVLVTVGWHGMGSVFGAGGVNSPLLQMDKALPAAPQSAARSQFMYESVMDSRRMAKKAAYSAPAPREKDLMKGDAASVSSDLLMEILSLQRVDGGFDLSKAYLGRLGLDAAAVAKASKTLPGDGAEALRVLHTALVLALLEARFGDVRDVWFSAVKKSRAWLKKATAGWGSPLEGQTVTRWAETAAARAKITV